MFDHSLRVENNFAIMNAMGKHKNIRIYYSVVCLKFSYAYKTRVLDFSDWNC